MLRTLFVPPDCKAQLSFQVGNLNATTLDLLQEFPSQWLLACLKVAVRNDFHY